MEITIRGSGQRSGAADEKGSGRTSVMKKIIEAQIIGHKEIAEDVFRITLQTGLATAAGEAGEPEPAVIPGQFVNVYLRDKSILLPRPISICRADRDRIILVYRVVGKEQKNYPHIRRGKQSGSVRLSATVTIWMRCSIR
jgi:hypothetical protein